MITFAINKTLKICKICWRRKTVSVCLSTQVFALKELHFATILKLNAHNKLHYHSHNWLQFLRRIMSIVSGIKDQEQRKFSQIKRPCYEW